MVDFKKVESDILRQLEFLLQPNVLNNISVPTLTDTDFKKFGTRL